MADLRASSKDTVVGDSEDAGWGDLLGNRYRKGKGATEYKVNII